MATTALRRPAPIPLHGHARLRRWLGEKIAGDPAMGDLVWRRMVHLSGALVLLYFVIPGNFYIFPWDGTTTVILLLLLEAALIIEALRLAGYVDVPMVRPYEERRIAGYCWYAVGLATAVLLFPAPIAVAVVLGAAFVDPILGELRRRGFRPEYEVLAAAVYLGLAFASLRLVGGWNLPATGLGAVLATAAALAVEGRRWPLVDDDFMMPVVPGVVLLLVLTFWPGGVTG